MHCPASSSSTTNPTPSRTGSSPLNSEQSSVTGSRKNGGMLGLVGRRAAKKASRGGQGSGRSVPGEGVQRPGFTQRSEKRARPTVEPSPTPSGRGTVSCHRFWKKWRRSGGLVGRERHRSKRTEMAGGGLRERDRCRRGIPEGGVRRPGLAERPEESGSRTDRPTFSRHRPPSRPCKHTHSPFGRETFSCHSLKENWRRRGDSAGGVGGFRGKRPPGSGTVCGG